MKYKDSRLPKGISIWKNDYNEFVATEYNEIVQFEGRTISASRTLEGAIQNYLNKDTLHFL